MASLAKKKDVWYGIFTVRGRQKWIRIGRVSKTTAKTILAKLESGKEKKNFGFSEATPIKFFVFIEKYLSYSKTNKALGTYKRDELCSMHLSRFFKDIWLDKITPHDIEKYKIKRLNDGVKARTVNIELRCLSNMLRKAVEWNHLLDNPFSKVKLLKQHKKPPRFLTKDELKKFIEAATPRYKTIIRILANTGLRESELRHIKLEDIDYENRTLTVHAKKTGDFRVVPLNEEAYADLSFLRDKFYSTTRGQRVLMRTKEQNIYLFCDEKGQPIKKLTSPITKTAKKAGLKGVSPHTLRHTFGSHLVMSGVDLRTVQRLMGHKSITTTMMYAHLTEDHLARGVEKLPWIVSETKN